MELAPVGQLHTYGSAALHQHPHHVGAGVQYAAVALDQLAKGMHRVGVAALDHRHADRLEREGHHLEHQPRQCAFGAQAAMQYPGRQQGAQQVGPDFALQPGARALQRLAEERGCRVQPLLPGPLGQRLGHRLAPQLVAQQREDQLGVVFDMLQRRLVGRTITSGQCIETRDIGGARGAQGQVPAVGQQHAGGGVVVSVGQTRRMQLLPQFGISRADQEQRMRRRQGVVQVTRHGQGIGADAATQHRLALEHTHRTPAPGQYRGADQRVDATAHNDGIELAHPVGALAVRAQCEFMAGSVCAPAAGWQSGSRRQLSEKRRAACQRAHRLGINPRRYEKL